MRWTRPSGRLPVDLTALMWGRRQLARRCSEQEAGDQGVTGRIRVIAVGRQQRGDVVGVVLEGYVDVDVRRVVGLGRCGDGVVGPDREPVRGGPPGRGVGPACDVAVLEDVPVARRQDRRRLPVAQGMDAVEDSVDVRGQLFELVGNAVAVGAAPTGDVVVPAAEVVRADGEQYDVRRGRRHLGRGVAPVEVLQQTGRVEARDAQVVDPDRGAGAVLQQAAVHRREGGAVAVVAGGDRVAECHAPDLTGGYRRRPDHLADGVGAGQTRDECDQEEAGPEPSQMMDHAGFDGLAGWVSWSTSEVYADATAGAANCHT